MISVTLLGESLAVVDPTDPPLLARSRARDGDLLAVTGPLGGSAAGLRVLASNQDRADEELSAAHLRPTPRVAAGLELVRAGIRCGIDVSDGLVADVGHICERSDVDAEIDSKLVPIHPAVTARFPDQALELALTGGEDYELVCTGRPADLERASDALRAAGQRQLTIIGRIGPRQGERPEVRVLDARGVPMALTRLGYKHFAMGTSS